MSASRARGWLPQAVIVIAILESISNLVSALPTAALPAQSVAVQRRGGFASTLAAAQSGSATPLAAVDEGETSDALVEEISEATCALNVRASAAGNFVLKGLPNRGVPLTGSRIAVAKTAVSGCIASAANQVAVHSLQPSLRQPGPRQSSLPQPSSAQPSILPTQTAVAQDSVADAVAEIVQPGLETTSYAAAQRTSVPYAASILKAGSGGSSAGSTDTASAATDSLAPGVLMPTMVRQANWQETSMTDRAPEVVASTTGGISSGAVAPQTASSSAWTSLGAGVAFAEPALPAETTQLPGVSIKTSQSASTPASVNAAPVSEWNSSQDAFVTAKPSASRTLSNAAPVQEWDGSQQETTLEELPPLTEGASPSAVSATTGQLELGVLSSNVVQDDRSNAWLTNSPALEFVQSRGQVVQAVEPVLTAPVLLASAAPQAEPAGVGSLHSLSSFEAVQTNSATTLPPEEMAQAGPTMPAGMGTALPGIVDEQISAPPSLNPAAQWGAVRAAMGVAAPRMAGALVPPNVQAAHPGAGVPMTIPAPAAPVKSGLAEASAMANQTPFSVFFSDPGTGTESAAATLPKMILPVTGAVIRGSQMSGANAPGTNAQAGSLQSGKSASSASQNVTATNSKDSPAGTESGSLQGGQPVHRDADLSAASVQFASSQTTAAPAPGPAPPASAGVTVPSSGQVALATDSLPKPDTLPGNASGSLPTPAPAAAETPAVAVPGPVQMAQMVNRVGQSEMRIGMNTSAFGSVEVRTTVHASDVGLLIGSEKGDLRTLLANDLPAITNTLQQQNLRLNSVNFMQGFAFSNNNSGGGDSQQRSFVPTRAPANSTGPEVSADDSSERLPSAEFGMGQGSLSILA
jgi:hypothetical protein